MACYKNPESDKEVAPIEKDIVKWSYPCSGKIVGTCSKDEYPDMRTIYLSDIYHDKQRRYWKTYGGAYRIWGSETASHERHGRRCIEKRSLMYGIAKSKSWGNGNDGCYNVADLGTVKK
jgi:hypothetical protein